jgi:hypothetical protein
MERGRISGQSTVSLIPAWQSKSDADICPDPADVQLVAMMSDATGIGVCALMMAREYVLTIRLAVYRMSFKLDLGIQAARCVRPRQISCKSPFQSEHGQWA